MRHTWLAITAIAIPCLVHSPAMAQTAIPAEAGPPAATPAPAPAVVPNGTQISVEITQLVSTRTAKPDDMFDLKLAEPVMLNGIVVIPAGIVGKGIIIDSGKPGMGGKPGKLVLAARYLEFEGRQIPIRGLRMSLGAKDNVGGAVAASVVVGVFGLAVTGGHMEVQPGTRAIAKLGADFTPTAPASPTPANPTPAAQPDAVVPAAPNTQ